MPWNPQNTWTEGNFYPENALAFDTLTVATTATMSDVGVQRDTDGSHPGYLERGAAVDALAPTGALSVMQGWDDCGPNHLEVHFTSSAARDAYATALAAASSPKDVAAVVQNYRDHAVGGFWGSLEVAP